MTFSYRVYLAGAGSFYLFLAVLWFSATLEAPHDLWTVGSFAVFFSLGFFLCVVALIPSDPKDPAP